MAQHDRWVWVCLPAMRNTPILVGCIMTFDLIANTIDRSFSGLLLSETKVVGGAKQSRVFGYFGLLLS